MSVGLRDQRVKVYAYSDASSDGWSTPTYSVTTTYWARQSSPTGRESTIAGQAGQSVDAVFTFAGEAVVTANGALRGADNLLYKITSVLPRRLSSGLKEIVVTAVYADEQNMAVDDVGSGSSRLLLENGSDALLLEDGFTLLLEAA